MYSLWNWFEAPLCGKTNINCWRTDDTAQTAFLWKSRNNYFSFPKMNHQDVNLSRIFSGWSRNLTLGRVFSRGDICDSHFLWADSSFSYTQLYQQFSNGFLIFIINVEHSCLEVYCLYWEMLEWLKKCLSFGSWSVCTLRGLRWGSAMMWLSTVLSGHLRPHFLTVTHRKESVTISHSVVH